MMDERGSGGIVFLARSLERGGAERQLVTLARGLSERVIPVTVISFYGGGALERDLAGSAARLVALDKRGRWDLIGFPWRLVRSLHRYRGAVLHGYLTVPNLLLALMKPLLRGSHIVWGLRASNMDLSRYDWLSRLTYTLETKLSSLPDLIVANSLSGKRHAVERGFPEEKIVVIPNGIDTCAFRHDPDGRVRLRRQWGIAEGDVLVGLAARLDPMKDHFTFLAAAAESSRQRPELRFVCIGDGPAAYRERLQARARALGIEECVVWAGACSDMVAVYGALDIACSASWGEGFSNSIAEAMACGVPCAVTDVGDSALVVGETGRVVPPQDPTALALAILEVAAMPKSNRERLGRAARVRIETEFSVDQLVERTIRTLGLSAQ